MMIAASIGAALPDLSGPDRLQMVVLNLYSALLVGGVAANVWIWRASRRGVISWPRGARALAERPFVWVDLLWIVAVIFTCSGVVGYGFSIVSGDGPPSGIEAIVLTSLAVHWPALIGIGLLVVLRGASWHHAFGVARGRLAPDLRCGLVAFLAMTPIVFVHLLANWTALRAFGVEPALQQVASHLLEEAPPLAACYKVFTAVVLAPVAEELLFRGLVFPLAARKIQPARATVAVSLVFAAIHGDLSVMLPLFAVSLTLCAAYQASRSIAVPVLMHMLFNGVNLVMMSILLPAAAGQPGVP